VFSNSAGNLAPTGSCKTFRDFQLQSAAIEIWCTTGVFGSALSSAS
jgi:hypothetical protein